MTFKDMLGVDLERGSRVVFSRPTGTNSSTLGIGTVLGFTKKGVQIELDEVCMKRNRDHPRPNTPYRADKFLVIGKVDLDEEELIP